MAPPHRNQLDFAEQQRQDGGEETASAEEDGEVEEVEEETETEQGAWGNEVWVGWKMRWGCAGLEKDEQERWK